MGRAALLCVSLGLALTLHTSPCCGAKKSKLGVHSVAGHGGRAVLHWGVLGPFPIGKSELDGDPLEGAPGGARGYARRLVKGGKTKPEAARSELVEGGTVKWKLLQATASGHLDLAVDDAVDWQSIVTGVGGHEVLEWQGLLVAQLKVDTANADVRVSCSGVGSFYLDPLDDTAPSLGPLVGNPYMGQDRVAATVGLTKGRYILRLRPRVKHRGQIACRSEVLPGGHRSLTAIGELRPKFVPDWVRGVGVLGVSVIVAVEFANPSASWVVATVVSASPAVVSVGAATALPRVAPSQSVMLNVFLETTAVTDDGCLAPFTLEFALRRDGSAAATPVIRRVDVALRCRSRGQSVVATFVDADGSVQNAAVVHPSPTAPCAQLHSGTGVNGGCPVLLTLHGTSISASDSADAYKMMKPGASEYTFGIADGWLLAPSRHGAHNWEGVGRRHALAAVAWLGDVTKGAGDHADVARLIVAGHSMGGHGAWLFGVLEPGRTLCLNPNAGWLRKEQYGDSNTLFTHDLRLDTVDARLKYILEASVAENMADVSAANLDGGMPVLARVGSADKAVHPWYTRRMVRIALALGVDAALTELSGKEHWWWDTKDANDGGAVNDAELRRFFKRCAARTPLPTTAFTLVAVNPAATGRKFGVRIEQQHVPYQRAEIHCAVSESPRNEWRLETLNVRRFSLENAATDRRQIIDSIDGQVLSSVQNKTGASQHFCSSPAGVWSACEGGPAIPRGNRGPDTYGPIRQVFESKYLIVFGTQGTAGETSRLQSLAVFVANLVHATGDGLAVVVPDTAPLGDSGAETNVVFVGGARWNRWASELLPSSAAVHVSNSAVTLGGCEHRGRGIGVAALLPIRGGLLGLVLDGVDLDGVTSVVELATPTIPPMVRQPFTNTLPDYVVTSPRVRDLGAGGILAAGFWGNEWEWRADTAFSRSCSRPASQTAPGDIERDDL